MTFALEDCCGWDLGVSAPSAGGNALCFDNQAHKFQSSLQLQAQCQWGGMCWSRLHTLYVATHDPAQYAFNELSVRLQLDASQGHKKLLHTLTGSLPGLQTSAGQCNGQQGCGHYRLCMWESPAARCKLPTILEAVCCT